MLFFPVKRTNSYSVEMPQTLNALVNARVPVALPADGTCCETPQMYHFTANKTTIWRDCGACHVLCQQSVETMAWLTFLTVVKLVKLTGFGLALAEDQVVSDVTIGVVGRFPL